MANAVLYLLGLRKTDADGLRVKPRRTCVLSSMKLAYSISGKYQPDADLSILDLEKVSVDDVMVPHNEVIGIDLDDERRRNCSCDSGQRTHATSGVYQRCTIDNVAGYSCTCVKSR